MLSSESTHHAQPPLAPAPRATSSRRRLILTAHDDGRAARSTSRRLRVRRSGQHIKNATDTVRVSLLEAIEIGAWTWSCPVFACQRHRVFGTRSEADGIRERWWSWRGRCPLARRWDEWLLASSTAAERGRRLRAVGKRSKPAASSTWAPSSERRGALEASKSRLRGGVVVDSRGKAAEARWDEPEHLFDIVAGLPLALASGT